MSAFALRITQQSRTKQDTPPLVLFLFGIPFAVVGLGIFLFGLSMLRDYHRMGAWQKVPATFSKVKFHERRGSKGGRTWMVTGKYSYRWQGVEYTNDRITIEDGSSSEHDFWWGLFQEIDGARKEGRTFNVLVDPADPAESVAVRNVSIAMIVMPPFGLVFLLAGLGVMGLGVREFLRKRELDEHLARYPNQPWRLDNLGHGFRINEGAFSKASTLCLVGIGGTCFIGIFIAVLASDSTAPLFAKLIVGFFALVIVALDFGAVYTLLRYFKYGDPTLMLSEWPVALGKPFVGAVAVARHIDQDAGGVKITLKCLKKTTTGSGKQRHTTTDELYACGATVKRDLGTSGRSAIPFTLEIPDHLPSRSPETNPEIEWKLEVSAETPGIDFAAEFPVPVYQVDDPDLVQKRALG